MRIFGNRKPNEDTVKTILKGIEGVAVESVMVEGGMLRVVAQVQGFAANPATEREMERRLAEQSFSGIKSIQVILTAHKDGTAGSNSPMGGDVSGGGNRGASGAASEGASGAASKGASKAVGAGGKTRGIDVPVKHIIAVSSGKGGVGKSTVAINLAAALSAAGMSVGVLDGDIYGPSLPRMTGTAGQKPEQEDGKITPVMAHGLRLMSIGYMVAEEAPMIWRGPMIQSALKQLLADVNWGGVDVLIIDLPPGTGDAQLTLVQQVNLTGAVVVSTPQDIALIDARKGLEMFRKMDVPILGVVENMSYYCCAECGARNDVFGHGGAQAEAKKVGVPFLGEVPLHASIRAQGDAGVPIVLAEPNSPQAKAFDAIAQMVIANIAKVT